MDIKSTIRLFGALPIESHIADNGVIKDIINKTIRRGFVFAPKLFSAYTIGELNNFITIIEKEVGLTPEKMNASFHKSWEKVRDAPILQLVMEQIVHYITTYGFEDLGIYSENSVYIPYEKLEIPEITENIKLVVIKGYTKEELHNKVIKMLQSGIALSSQTIEDIIDVIDFTGIEDQEIDTIKNKEVMTILCDKFNKLPISPVEFLRYIIYKITKRTLLIKDKETIEAIKSGDEDLDITSILRRYDSKKLAEIFYRFKPIFLAIKSRYRCNSYINELRRLAKKYHKPMKEDYLNSITSMVSKGNPIGFTEFSSHLANANIFRKIRLAYALKYRIIDSESILYKIRNGKSYATKFESNNKEYAENVLKLVLISIINDIKKNVDGKKIFIPDYINYTLPSSEKQFVGNFPSGTSVSVNDDLVFGVHWENVDNNRIDLDFSLLNANVKMGWDGYYRNSGKDVLFSGDMTDAPKPNGASELFCISRDNSDEFIAMLNYFNFNDDIDVPFKVVVANDKLLHFKKVNMCRNAMIDQNDVVAITKSSIDVKQKIIGLVMNNKFYFIESKIGKRISSGNNEYTNHARRYLIDFHKNLFNLKDILESAGAIIVSDEKQCDIDLSPQLIEKDTILKLII